MKRDINLIKNYRIKRLKKLCNNPAYFAGSEMYRLLNYEVLQGLIDKIKLGDITLGSTLLFGKRIINEDEQFLYILNKYIIFIRNQCYINTCEFIAIIEETLKSDYSEILFSHLDFNHGSNAILFFNEFKRMFLDSLFNNYIKLFCKENPNHPLSEMQQLSLDNAHDLDKLFRFFRGMINIKRKDLYNLFVKTDFEGDDEWEKQEICKMRWRELAKKYSELKQHLDMLGL